MPTGTVVFASAVVVPSPAVMTFRPVFCFIFYCFAPLSLAPLGRGNLENSEASPPQHRVTGMHEAAIVAEAVRPVLGEEQRTVEVDIACLLADQERGRH